MKKKQIVIAFIFGTIFCVALIFWSILQPTPSPAQYVVFRTILALSAAGVAAMVPGFINVDLNTKKNLIIRASGALAVFVIVFFFNPAPLELQSLPRNASIKPNIKITSHSDGGIVNPTETVEGESKNIPLRAKIWLVVYSYSDQMFYPHLMAAVIENSGKWINYEISIGSSIDSGKKFDIVPLLLDENSLIEFQNYVSNAERHGLTRLPQGVQPFGKITVKRR